MSKLDALREKEAAQIRELFNDPYYNPIITGQGGAPEEHVFMINDGKFSTGLTYIHPGQRDGWMEVRVDEMGREYHHDH